MTISYRVVRPVAEPPLALTGDQTRVATHRHGALTVVGAVRTGKTSALVEAAMSGLDEGAPAVVFVTSSRARRLQVRAQVAVRAVTAASRLTVTTIHGLCQSVVQKFSDEDQPPLVLSAPRQDAYVREILAGQPASAWPQRFDEARTTVRFGAQVREAVAACQRAGLTPHEVRTHGLQTGRDEWVALGHFYQEYVDILGLAGVLDYPEMLIRACRLLAEPPVLSSVRPSGSLVLIDDIEDMDAAQLAVASSLVDATTPTIVTANPDCQVYGFRGAHSRSALEQARSWASAEAGSEIVVLRQGFGVAREVERACVRIKQAIPLPAGLKGETSRHVIPDTVGQVTKLCFTDAEAEADQIAALLRQAHIVDRVPYDQMAILVRKRDAFARYAQACEAVEVPVARSGDEIQLGHEPVVATLLAGLRLVRDGENPSASDLRQVTMSPLGQGTVDGVAQVVRAGRAKFGETVADVLWAMWQASGWQSRLMEEVEGSARVALAANCALDAVVALFALAEKLMDMDAAAGIGAVDEAVRSEEIPQDLPRSSSWSAAAVRLTTAHRAKGRSWAIVVVPGVEEGVWPLDAPLGGLVSVADMTAELASVTPRENAMAERRLFLTACASARERLVVTAVSDEERTPSILFDQIDAVTVHTIEPAPVAVWSGARLLGELRRVVADETAHPGLRQAASQRLAHLAGRPGFFEADPDHWWGLDPAVGEQRTVPGPVVIQASQLESLFNCPRRWCLSHRVRADRPSPVAASIGSIVHGLVQDPDASLAQMIERLEQQWAGLEFQADWLARHEWDETVAALGRYEAQRLATGRRLVATEAPVSFSIDDGGGIEVRGRIDRIEQDETGAIWIVDYKTGRQAPTAAQGAANIQLGLYQWAVMRGALADLVGPQPVLGGAQLVYLRCEASRGSTLPKVLDQDSLARSPYLTRPVTLPVLEWDRLADLVCLADQRRFDNWAHQRLVLGAAIMRRAEYPAIASAACRSCPARAGCPVVMTTGGAR
ncbi:MAG: PD-(D/E)XK nuclease family protein [Propionibacteriaceae bacterium]|jgi:superfamily I DNA/RNA helicase/RecB family exonuclease|nr:PD-(D/E)XK nuclease family protein [Propionibacteriaceae bacterium]